MGCVQIEIIMHDQNCPDGEPQAKFLIHGLDDVLWTDDKESILAYVKEELDRMDARKT